jgi:osmotically inducible lipoprotein OsmB
MKHFFVAIVLAGSLTACNAYNPTDRAVAGGLIGAGTGAVVGGVATRSPGGAIAGAVIGGAGGAIIGAATTPSQSYSRRRSCGGYDEYGRYVRYAC